MKTDDLVTLLATGIEPIDPKLAVRRSALAVTVGLIGALGLCCGLLGVNPRLSHELVETTFWVRESYCSALAWLGFLAVTRLARPGRPLGFAAAGIAGVLFLMWTVAAVELSTAPPYQRAHLIFGATAAVCPLLIAMVSAPLFVGYVCVLRGLAPTRLRCSGAGAGFAAGSLGALVYSVHCPELPAPFISLWYLLGMLIPTTIGALLGPRLLRW